MNASCYKVIFSKRHGILVAVGEHAAAQGKAAGACNRSVAVNIDNTAAVNLSSFIGLVKALVASSVLACTPALNAYAAGPAANALPTNGVVQTGAANISTSGANMTINQGTDKASINWGSFNIGSGAAVNVQQNSASSVLLNRVIGNDASQIFGKLSANGQVILINPNGIVFGKGGSVTASAFTASTFGMTDKDFQAGQYKYNRNGSTAGVSVEDSASIQTTTPGGYVALMGASVNNQGHISTQQGAVVMAAGESVALPQTLTNSVGIPLSSKVRLEIAPSSIAATVDNGGVITTEGGQVLMQASSVVDAVSRVANASVSNTGSIDTSAAQGGAVSLQAEGGQIKVAGSIKADSTQAGHKGGDVIIGRDEQTGALAHNTDVSQANIQSNKGFVETSGEHLTVDGIQIQAGEWLLDPTDITISASATTAVDDNASPTRTFSGAAGTSSSVVQASTIGTALSGGTSVTIKTSSSANGTATGDADGNITVTTGITQTGNNTATLTLLADNGITVNSGANITGSTTGKLNVVMTSFGATKGTNNTANAKGISLNANITTHGGNVTLTDNGTVGVKLGDSVASTIDTRLDTTKAITDSSNASAGDLVVQSKGSTSGPIIVGNGGALTVHARNIALDQTGGSVNSSTGAITTGTSRAASGASGVLFNNGGSRLNAASNIYAAGNALAGRGVYLGSNAVLTAGGTVSLVGDSLNSGYGVMIGGYQFQAPTVTAGTINVQGNVTTALGSTGYGIYSNRWASGAQQLSATGSINLEGTVSGAGSGSGIAMGTSGWNIGYIKLVAGGDITVRGNTRTSASDTSIANSVVGLQVFAGDVGIGGSGATGNINILGETLNASANAILVSQNQQPGSAYQSYFSANGGNLLFQGNKGTVQINGNTTSATLNATAGGVGMTAKNMTFDNTGAGMTVNGVVGTGSIDNATGAVTARGTGAATGGNGVSLLDTASSYQATGNINISGARSDANSTAVRVATNLSAGGNLIAQSKGGQIYLSAGSVTGSGSSAVYSGGLIAGGNLTIDNRGSTIAADGSISAAGSQTAGTIQGVVIGGGGLSATGLLQVQGASSSSSGLTVSSLLQGEQLTVQGANNSSSTAAVGLTGANIRTTGSSGTSTFTGSNAALTGTGVYLSSTETFTVAAGTTLTQSGSISSGTGTLVSNGAGTLNVTGSMSGSGSLSQSGTGTTILTADNGYAGTTTISAGTINVGNGGTTGTLGAGAVTNDATLIIDRTATTSALSMSTLAAGGITGTGSFTAKVGGDLSVDRAITQNGASSSITFEAGVGIAAGTATSGDVSMSQSVTTSNSGTLTVFSGNPNTSALSTHITGATGATQYKTYNSAAAAVVGAVSGTRNFYYRSAPSLSISGVTLSKTYDGTTALTAGELSALAGGTVTGVDSDSISIGNLTATSGSYVNKNWTGATQTLSLNYAVPTLSLAGWSVTGYQSTSATNGTLTINKADLTVTATQVSKTYDGTTSATGTGTVGVLAGTGDVVNSSGSQAFTDKNAGTANKTVVASGITIKDGTNADMTANYNINYVDNSTSTINKADLTVTATQVSKTYDGTTSATGTGTVGVLAGAGAGDVVNSSGSQAFTDKNAGTANKTVVASGVTIKDGTNADMTANYNISYVDNSTSTIHKADLTVTATQVSKTYDGTTSATGTGTVGVLAGTGDVVNSSGSQAFTDKNAGTANKTVVASGITIKDGTNADMTANYNINYVDNSTSTINKADLTVTATQVSKTYDGTTSATGTGTVGVLAGAGAGDVVNSSGSQAFTDKNAGTANKTVVASGVTIKDGTNADMTANYNISYVDNSTSTIHKADLTQITASKTYDGLNTVTHAQMGTIAGVHNETFTATAGTATISDPNVATANKTLTDLSGLTLTSTNGGISTNYNLNSNLPSAGANNLVTIDKYTLSASLTGESTKTYDGLTNATLSNSNFSLSGLVAGEGITVGQTVGYYLSAHVVDNTTSVKGSVNTTLTASHYTANTGTDLNNYILPSSATGLIGVITPAPLTVKVNNTSAFVTQDARLATDQGISYTGFVNGETAATALTGNPTRTYTGTSNTPIAGSYTGVYSLSGLPTALHGNYSLTLQNGDLTVVPADKLLITITSQTDTYGNRNSSSAAKADANSVSALYCLDTNCTSTATLSITQLSDTQWKASDNTGSYVVFDTALIQPSYATSGKLAVGNYTYDSSEITPLSLPNGNFTGRATNGGVLTITPVALSLTANQVSKTYDGTTTLQNTSITPAGVITGDDASAIAASGSFQSANVASNIGFTLNGLSLTGNDAANYSLSVTSLNGTGSITAKQVNLTGVSIANKTYDGTLLATITQNGSLSGLVGNETLGVSNLTASFVTASIGNNKPVNLSASLIDGSGLATNYSLVTPSTTGNIVDTIRTPNNTPVRPPSPIVPDTRKKTQSSIAGLSIYAQPPIEDDQNADACNPNHLESCTCEDLPSYRNEKLSLCYQISLSTPSRKVKKPS